MKGFAGKLVIVFIAVNWKDVFIKTIKTGWQAIFGTFTTTVPVLFSLTGDALVSAFYGLISSALSAAACAVWNGVLAPALRAMKMKADEQFPME